MPSVGRPSGACLKCLVVVFAVASALCVSGPALSGASIMDSPPPVLSLHPPLPFPDAPLASAIARHRSLSRPSPWIVEPLSNRTI
ncbi:hypothetical protein ZIOFF_058617 [Zingiber officinale]|uniref:Secreted protein n=1 Tax=Zingiber officinale TaxID=94328 RepID=A0A8J5F922_ZINOF|nr:hypothetical protein ZIOFF_058617 [Zingiber officinale]